MPMPKQSTERSYYPSGALRGECVVANGQPIGVTRLWHENGVLSWECPHDDNGREHGLVRQWNAEGKLLGEYRMDHGTGLERHWHENGQLERECQSIHGRLCGRFRCWLEDGELVSESYYIFDRQVSKKKYSEACTQDPNLPRYEDSEEVERRTPPSTTPGRREFHVSDYKRVEYQRFVAELRAQGVQAEARAWLSSSEDRYLGEMTPRESIEVVEAGYRAGARRITAINVERDTTNCLLVEVPARGKGRAGVFEWSAELAKISGFDPDDDWGQGELFIFLS
jgi:hypothetical protein